jgi:hypothetical protein
MRIGTVIRRPALMLSSCSAEMPLGIIGTWTAQRGAAAELSPLHQWRYGLSEGCAFHPVRFQSHCDEERAAGKPFLIESIARWGICPFVSNIAGLNELRASLAYIFQPSMRAIVGYTKSVTHSFGAVTLVIVGRCLSETGDFKAQISLARSTTEAASFLVSPRYSTNVSQIRCRS